MTYNGIVPTDYPSKYSVRRPSCIDNTVFYSIENDSPSVFITISIKYQLKMFFETNKDIESKLLYRKKRVSETNHTKIIFDGLAFKKK